MSSESPSSTGMVSTEAPEDGQAEAPSQPCGPATSDRGADRSPRWWLLLSPEGNMRTVSVHLHRSGGPQSLWGVVLLGPRSSRSAVVGGRSQCCSDAPLLVLPPRAEPTLPPPHCRGGSIVVSRHHTRRRPPTRVRFVTIGGGVRFDTFFSRVCVSGPGTRNYASDYKRGPIATGPVPVHRASLALAQ